jgi:hypothetical protein
MAESTTYLFYVAASEMFSFMRKPCVAIANDLLSPYPGRPFCTSEKYGIQRRSVTDYFASGYSSVPAPWAGWVAPECGAGWLAGLR